MMKNDIVLGRMTITHPDKIIFPKEDILKIDLIVYFSSVAARLLPLIEGRPLMVERCPNGLDQGCFIQKNLAHKMEGISEFAYPKKHEPGKHQTFYLENLTGLLNLINFNVIEIHTWACHYPDITHADQIIFDLDPDVEKTWKEVIEAGLLIKAQLEEWDIKSWVKLTGGKGLHVVIPIKPEYSWEESYQWSKQVALWFVEKYPDQFSAEMSKLKRKNNIFIDYFRNISGATAIAPYSVRARVGAPIAMPVSWSELEKIKAGNAFTVQNVQSYLKKHPKNPWADFLKSPQELKNIV